uniref:Uncharacterized protein n=1 Tax=Glossina pallidipes TaxID=7398 RepID=A0A1A9ZTI7_GLOPL
MSGRMDQIVLGTDSQELHAPIVRTKSNREDRAMAKPQRIYTGCIDRQRTNGKIPFIYDFITATEFTDLGKWRQQNRVMSKIKLCIEECKEEANNLTTSFFSLTHDMVELMASQTDAK